MPTARLLAKHPTTFEAKELVIKKRELTVGSDATNDLVLRDPSVSKRHAVLRRVGKRYELTDLNSLNGTFINGKQIKGPTPIIDSDEIAFGLRQFMFLDPAQPRSKVLTSELKRRKRRALPLAVGIVIAISAVSFAITEHLINVGFFARVRKAIVQIQAADR